MGLQVAFQLPRHPFDRLKGRVGNDDICPAQYGGEGAVPAAALEQALLLRVDIQGARHGVVRRVKNIGGEPQKVLRIYRAAQIGQNGQALQPQIDGRGHGELPVNLVSKEPLAERVHMSAGGLRRSGLGQHVEAVEQEVSPAAGRVQNFTGACDAGTVHKGRNHVFFRKKLCVPEGAFFPKAVDILVAPG